MCSSKNETHYLRSATSAKKTHYGKFFFLDSISYTAHVECADILFVWFSEPGTFSLENPSFVIKESIGKAYIKVNRTQGTDGRVEVTWKTTDQTAVNGKDYHGGSGTLVFEHGEQAKSIAIDIIDDKDFEKDETFLVELIKTSAGANIGHIRSAAVNIVNDDGKQ